MTIKMSGRNNTSNRHVPQSYVKIAPNHMHDCVSSKCEWNFKGSWNGGMLFSMKKIKLKFSAL